jgi:hypothetical protein
MTPETFTTQSLAPKDRYEAWHDWFQPVLDVTRTLPTNDECFAKNVVWKLGGLVISRVSAPPVRVMRTKAHVRCDPTDHWVITYAQRGAMVIRTGTGSSEVPASVPYLWSLGEEMECERTYVDRVQFFLSRDAFRDIASVLDTARGSVLDMPLGRLLGDSMLALERRLPSLTSLDVPALTKAVQVVVAAAVAPSHPAGHPRKGPNRPRADGAGAQIYSTPPALSRPRSRDVVSSGGYFPLQSLPPPGIGGRGDPLYPEATVAGSAFSPE